MIVIPLTVEKYETLLKGLMDYRGPDLTSFTLPVDDKFGKIVTPQVVLSFDYDRVCFELHVTVLEKHGLAKFASEGTIKAHLIDLLGKV